MVDRQYEPTRCTMIMGPRMFSLDRQRMHDFIADGSPADPDFAACTGDRGHPGMFALGDVVDPNAAIMVGEIGGSCRITVEPVSREAV